MRILHAFSLWLAIGAGATLLSACGGGAATESNPPPVIKGNGGDVYSGPVAQTDDIRLFQIEVWEKLRPANRCGGCHYAGGQSPQFVREDDINLAYAAVTPLVDLDTPALSRLAVKVGGGHNCWLTDAAACATLITSYIEAWADGSAAISGRQIQLIPPAPARPQATLGWPEPPALAAFQTHVWNLLRENDNCSGCHRENAATPQAPFFAGDTLADAYAAVQQKIDLNNPQDSRLVVRLRDEFHNCWSDCADDAAEMLAGIQAFIAAFSGDPAQNVAPEPPMLFSNAVGLRDGIIASGGNRHETDVIALYEFRTGTGNTAVDTSGAGAELNLTLSGDVNWVGGYGIRIVNGRAQGSTTASKKLHDLITATGEYSIEAWVVPANVTQEGPARIVSYSGSTTARNFTLGQTQYNYDFLHRSGTTDANGNPALSTADADEDLQASLQHVVATFDPVNGRRIYVNGVYTDDIDPSPPGNLADWKDNFALVLGNEVSGDRLWQGIIKLVAIHNRALTEAQIQQNFAVGVGEKYYLLFRLNDLPHVDGLADVPDNPDIPADSFIMFEVSQYDSYSYLFNHPTFINLNPAVTPDSIVIKGLRIGINGKEATVGQAYRNMNQTVLASAYDPQTGQRLSDLGTIIPIENGAQNDTFFLSFEQLGSATHVVAESSNFTIPPLPVQAPVADIGLRTFDEINATMAAVTGVSPTEGGVQSTFTLVRQALPTVENFPGFLSAHQMGITQLAIAYCNALVENGALRNTFFDGALAAGFDFNADVYAAFGATRQTDIAGDLYANIAGLQGGAGGELTSNPASWQVVSELDNPFDDIPDGVGDGLYNRLRESCPDPTPVPVPVTCDATRTRTIVKAMCSAVLGSAVMLVQ